MNFIHIDLKTGDGGYLIPNDESGQEIAMELLKDPKHIIGPYSAWKPDEFDYLTARLDGLWDVSSKKVL